MARSRWRTGGGQNSALRACMFVLCVNFRSFGVAAVVGRGFCR